MYGSNLMFVIADDDEDDGGGGGSCDIDDGLMM